MFNDDIIGTPKRYMATIALRAPGCGQPSRHRWQASHPSWVGLRTEKEREDDNTTSDTLDVQYSSLHYTSRSACCKFIGPGDLN